MFEFQYFIGKIQQAAGPNDHPTGPTFLHLYRTLSIYSVIRTPKSGYCTIRNCQVTKIAFLELKEIFHHDSTLRQQKLKSLV